MFCATKKQSLIVNALFSRVICPNQVSFCESLNAEDLKNYLGMKSIPVPYSKGNS